MSQQLPPQKVQELQVSAENRQKEAAQPDQNGLTSAERALIEQLKSASSGKKGMEDVANFLIGDINPDKTDLAQAVVNSALRDVFNDSKQLLDPSQFQVKMAENAKDLQKEGKLSPEETKEIIKKSESVKKPEVAELVQETAKQAKSEEIAQKREVAKGGEQQKATTRSFVDQIRAEELAAEKSTNERF